MTLLELRDINKKFNISSNEIHVLKDINLTIQKGEFVAIIGQSGSGKSTLMNIIGSLDSPSSGEYFIDGKEVGTYDSDKKAELRNKTFGFVFQRYNLIPSLNILQNVTLASIYKGDDKETRQKNATKILTNLGLKDKLLNYPNTLSGGQQQRVSIARALVNGAKIILADEPTGALDSASGEMVMEILKELHSLGRTIILVTHDPKIASYAERIVEIKDGEILKDSPNIKPFAKREIKNSDEIEVATEPRRSSLLKDRFMESFKMSISSIISHKLRSALTMLGIIIGIASVICVVAIGKGAQEEIISSIRAIGSNTITIFPGRGFGDMRSGRVNSLRLDDALFLSTQSYLDYSTPNTQTSGTITYENKTLNAYLRGGGIHSLKINGEEIAMGRSFNEDDIKNSSSVVVIDDNTKNELFKEQDPIGKIVFFNKRAMVVVGVLKKSEFDGFGAELLNLYAPYSTVINKITGDRQIRSITVKVKDEVNAQLAEIKLTEQLTALHGKKDFFTRNSDTIKKAVESTIGTMQLFISSIAIISLLVGGIGVMNIMLVTVTERTKEIGIRMAIGAKKRDILLQFLLEAILLCLIGCIFGLLVSFIIFFIFNSISSDFSMILTIPPMILALFASSFIGIIFGFLPARNASNLNPIEALIQE